MTPLFRVIDAQRASSDYECEVEDGDIVRIPAYHNGPDMDGEYRVMKNGVYAGYVKATGVEPVGPEPVTPTSLPPVGELPLDYVLQVVAHLNRFGQNPTPARPGGYL